MLDHVDVRILQMHPRPLSSISSISPLPYPLLPTPPSRLNNHRPGLLPPPPGNGLAAVALAPIFNLSSRRQDSFQRPDPCTPLSARPASPRLTFTCHRPPRLTSNCRRSHSASHDGFPTVTIMAFITPISAQPKGRTSTSTDPKGRFCALPTDLSLL